MTTTVSPQDAIVAGAIEAAEIVASRKVQASEDRVTAHIKGVQEFAEGLSESVQALRTAAVVMAESYGEMTPTLQSGMAAAVDRIKRSAAEVAVEASAEGAKITLGALREDLQGQVQALTEQIFGHLETQHRAATVAQDQAAAETLRGMMAHVADLTKDLSRATRVELSQTLTDRLKAAEATLEEHLSAGRTIEAEVRAVAAKVEKDHARLVSAGLAEVERRVEATMAQTREAVAKTLETREEQVQSATEDLTQKLGSVFRQYCDDLDRERAAVQDELKTGAVLTQEETVKSCTALVKDALAVIPTDPVPGPAGEPGPPGMVGTVKHWERDRLHSKGSCVSHFGGLWQCRANTEEEPSHSVHWDLINQGVESAQVSEDGFLSLRLSDGTRQEVGNVRGPQGPGWEHRGVFSGDATYSRLDVAIVRGTSYVALQDSPGECPGAGWQMVAQAKAGPAGKPGRVGKQGDPGPPGPIGPPGVVPPWRGRYVFGEQYRAGESVHFNGSSWIALRDGQLDLPKADGEQWDLMVHGLSGSQGGGSGAAVTSLSGELRIIQLTQAEYDALSPPDGRTLYLICG